MLFQSTRARVFAGVALAFLPLAACAPMMGSGAFAPDGFHSADYPYVVHYANPTAREILGPDWRLDNYVFGADGSPDKPKGGDRYEGPSRIDLRGDGKLVEFQHYFFDVKLDNRRNNSVIWLQSFPLTHDREDRNLSALVDDYANALSGAGFYAAFEDQGKEIRSKTYAAKVVEGKAIKIGDLDAYDARLELANVDQLRLDPNQRTAFIRVVLVRTNYMTTWYASPATPGFVTRGLVRIGYYAAPGDFDAGVPDFERFLQLVEFKAGKVRSRE